MGVFENQEKMVAVAHRDYSFADRRIDRFGRGFGFGALYLHFILI